MRPTLLALAAPLLLGWTPTAALAQSASPPAASSAGVKLQSSPTRIDALELSFFLPEGSEAQTVTIGANPTVGVELPRSLGEMIIEGRRSTKTDLTVAEVLDSMIEQFESLGSFVRETPNGKVFVKPQLEIRTAVQLSGLSGERVYMRFPATDVRPEELRGVTVFQTEPGRFIVFDLVAPVAVAAESRRMYETVVGTMDVTDRDALAARRGAALNRTKAVLASLTPEELRVLAESQPERWERMFTPARSGDDMDASEHGYRRIRVRKGFRGEVSGKSERSWNTQEKLPGLIVQLDAMAIETDLRIDTRAVYFVSEDLTEEAWTVRMALRQGDTTTESSVNGARSGTGMIVKLEQQNMAPTVTRPLIQGEGYLPQAITHLLSPLLARRAQVGEFASYAYNPGSNTITMRWDTVEQPADKPGLWIVRSRPDDNTPATSHVFNAQGRLMRSELHNGRLWEPIEPDRLLSLWKRKGLPLE
jgi:hypothetical protein